MAPTALDTLSPQPDSQIMHSGAQYLTQNGIDRLLGALLENIARNKPDQPVQWMIDLLSSSSSVEQAVLSASQDIHPGENIGRQNALLEVFKVLDKDGRGRIQLDDLQAYTSRHGMAPMEPSEVEQIFKNIDTDNTNTVTANDFLAYMGKATCHMSDSQVQDMVAAMTQA